MSDVIEEAYQERDLQGIVAVPLEFDNNKESSAAAWPALYFDKPQSYILIPDTENTADRWTHAARIPVRRIEPGTMPSEGGPLTPDPLDPPTLYQSSKDRCEYCGSEAYETDWGQFLCDACEESQMGD